MTTAAPRLSVPSLLLVSRVIHFDEQRRPGVLPRPGEADAYEVLASERLVRRTAEGLFVPTPEGRAAYEKTLTRTTSSFVLELVRRLAEDMAMRPGSPGLPPCQHPTLTKAGSDADVACPACGRQWVLRGAGPSSFWRVLGDDPKGPK